MNELTAISEDALLAEVVRYLAVIDAFRAQHCEPTWRRELQPESGPATCPVRHLEPDRLRGPS
jgi:hypothetical protein